MPATAGDFNVDAAAADHDLEHDPEKWRPVFGKDHAEKRSWNVMASEITFQRKLLAGRRAQPVPGIADFAERDRPDQ